MSYFLLVSADDPQFSGMPDGSSFKELVSERTKDQRYIQDRREETSGSVWGPVSLIVLLVLFCPASAGTGCFLAGATAGATGFGNTIRNEGMKAPAEARLSRLETNLLLTFETLKSRSQAPP